MSIKELRRISEQSSWIAESAKSGLFGQMQHLLGFGPTGFHTLHLTVEQLARQSFEEARSHCDAFAKNEISRRSLQTLKNAVQDLGAIPSLKGRALQKIREKYATASPFTKLLLLITGIYVAFRELRSHQNLTPIDPSEFYMCVMGQFYNRPICLWTGSMNLTALRIDLVFGHKKYQVRIYELKEGQKNPSRSTITFNKWEKTTYHIINYDVKSRESKALAARFFNSLRDRTNVFANFKTPYSTEIFDQTQNQRVNDVTVGQIDLLTQLQDTLDAIYKPPADSPFVNLHKIAQVIREL